jgi:glucose/arabinose dehydrogenase
VDQPVWRYRDSQVSGASKVGKFDGATGATINANFITGLSNPFQLAVLGDNLFVVNQFNFGVDEYNATTGALIKANFVSGMQQSPYGLAFSGNNLFVVSPNKVGKYDATTGATINADFITGLSTPLGIAVSGNNLFVANQSGLNVGE